MGVFGGRSVIEGLDGAGVVVTRLGTRVVAANRSARRHGLVRTGGSGRSLLGDETVASLRRRGTWPRSVQVVVDGAKVSAHAGAVRGCFGRTSGYLLVWDPADAEQRSREAIGHIAASTDELLGLSATLSRVATDAAEQAQAVSVATEQLTASIAEIARAAAECTAVVADSIMVADQAVGGLGRLDVSTTEISDVIHLISEVADRTHLLSLNATIEAARAGEAGKGFAVVADEVKQLAQRTTEATASIGDRVGAIQRDAASSADAVRRMGDAVAQIDVVQTTIAAALEQQRAATNEIAHNISAMALAVEEVSRSATGSRAAANQVAQQTEPLRENLLSPLASLAEQLTGALASHAQWRHRLDRAITAAVADITVETAARDDACKFGAWLHSELAQRFGGEARFIEIVALHRAFHGAAADVLGHALHGRRDEARAAMGPGTAYAAASAQLSDACRRWLDSLG